MIFEVDMTELPADAIVEGGLLAVTYLDPETGAPMYAFQLIGSGSAMNLAGLLETVKWRVLTMQPRE